MLLKQFIFSQPWCVQQKQSDLLLNADDLDAMWVCLRENCVIDDATGAEKVCHFVSCFFIFPNFMAYSTRITLLKEQFGMHPVCPSIRVSFVCHNGFMLRQYYFFHSDNLNLLSILSIKIIIFLFVEW